MLNTLTFDSVTQNLIRLENQFFSSHLKYSLSSPIFSPTSTWLPEASELLEPTPTPSYVPVYIQIKETNDN